MNPIEDAIVEEKFLAASGPGGQNVNKASKAPPPDTMNDYRKGR